MKIYLHGNIILDEWRQNSITSYWVREDTTCSKWLPRRYITIGMIDYIRYGVVLGTGLKHLEAMFQSISDDGDGVIQFEAKTYDEAKKYVDDMLVRLDKLVAFA